ncbi:Rap1a/Tai family immunity protein [Dechloromonas sp.]|uniref:Rap1a/Tai family immunity protein n=1 Tax=Dechloromonas sp. TaxID=1917218 RepID=UPI0011FDBA64|nr:Rap1a/Tai family immunity protein [Dechloromonas sp.]MBU3695555.1 hypothetical protein [Dechloromonas sp.]TEX48907.1 MAG: hypothetical protein CFR70_04745 [Rhodocyclaceae bacterium]
MKHILFIAALLAAGQAQAYTGQELREDCQAAEAFYAGEKSSDPYQSVRSGRCIGYLAGFADGYAIGDFLSEKVGVKLNAFCLPKTPDLSSRLVRAVLGGFDRVPSNTGVNTATLVASSLSRSFPCADSLEPKK